MQNKVKDFNNNKNCHRTPMPVYARILDIQSELGELSKEYLKYSKYGTSDFILEKDFELEFGDVLYSILSLANELNLDAHSCLDKALAKYQNRINTNHSMGSNNQ